MKKKVVICIMFIISLIYCSKCKYFGEYFGDVDVKNNSGHSISVYFAQGDEHISSNPDKLPDTLDRSLEIIKPDKKMRYFVTRRAWEDFFSFLPSETLTIYIFHTDTLNKYSWKEVCEDYLVLKRYDLSLEDLKKLNFKVPYPPSPIMRNMKMYPPYQN